MAHQITKKDRVLSIKGTEWHNLAEHVEDIPLDMIDSVLGYAWVEDAKHQTQSGEVKRILDTQVVMVDGEPIATVGTRYRPFPTEWFKAAVDRILGLSEDFKITTLGTVDSRRSTFACIDLARPIEVGKDVIKPYFSILDDRCGRKTLCLGDNATRSVCANTVAMARAEIDDKCRHTEGMGAFVSAVVADFQDRYQAIEEHTDTINRMVDRQLTNEEAETLVNRYVPKAPQPGSKRRHRGHEDAKAAVRHRINREASTLGFSKRSLWLTYNGLTGYVQHDKRRKASTSVLADRMSGDAMTKTHNLWKDAVALLDA